MRFLLPLFGTSVLAWGVVVAMKNARGHWEAMATTPIESAIGSAHDSAATDTSSTFSLPPERPNSYYDGILDRPLFSPERKPRTASPVAEATLSISNELAPAAPLAPPDLKISGIMGQANSRIALLAVGESPYEWLKAGQRVDDWQIAEIGETWVVLRNGKEEFRLEMYR